MRPDQDAQQAYLEQVEVASLMIPEVLMEDLEKSYVWRINHVPGDPVSSAYQEGQKAMVVHLRQLQHQARARLQQRADVMT